LKLLSWIIDLPFYEEFDLEQISIEQVCGGERRRKEERGGEGRGEGGETN
jgi:hypothetical protein